MAQEYRQGKTRKDPLDLPISSLTSENALDLLQSFSGMRKQGWPKSKMCILESDFLKHIFWRKIQKTPVRFFPLSILLRFEQCYI